MRAVIVRALPGIGDWLCALPAVAHIKRVNPRAHVTLVGLESVRNLVERYDDVVDDFVGFPGFPGTAELTPGSSEQFTAFLEEYRGNYDLCIQLHGSSSSINEFCLLLGARRTALASLAATSPIDYGDLTLIPFSRLHETERLMAIVNSALETKRESTTLPWFPIGAIDRQQAESALSPLGAHRPYVVLHAGARHLKRRWTVHGFAGVASELVKRGFWVVLTGTSAERDLATSIRLEAGPGVCSLAGVLGIGGTAAIIEGASLVVSNDTGIAHLSAAVGVPLVVVYVCSSPVRRAPRGPSTVLQVLRSELPCDERLNRFPTERLIEPTIRDVINAIDCVDPLGAHRAMEPAAV